MGGKYVHELFVCYECHHLSVNSAMETYFRDIILANKAKKGFLERVKLKHTNASRN